VKKYEYLVQAFVSGETPKEIKAVSRALTTLGKAGWELVAVVPQDFRGKSSLFYFKREKSN
jgi:hypothetical protein